MKAFVWKHHLLGFLAGKTIDNNFNLTPEPLGVVMAKTKYNLCEKPFSFVKTPKWTVLKRGQILEKI